MGDFVPPDNAPYFHGRISRQEAEEIIKKYSTGNGTFLLREDMTKFDNYTLSISYNNSIHHYQIERQYDGMVMIAQGRRFVGPIELIEHHAMNQDGLVTKPTVAVNCPANKAPIVFRGVTRADMEKEMQQRADRLNLKGKSREKALGEQRQQFTILVARELHVKQPWYHHTIPREEAEKRLKNQRNGTFLVRDKGDKTFALSIQFNGYTKHYKIDLRGSDKYAIEQGPRFDSIIQMIDHYYNKSDGLLCNLSVPCYRPGSNPPPRRNETPQYVLCENFHSQAASSNAKFDKRVPPPLPNPSPNTKRPPAPFPPTKVTVNGASAKAAESNGAVDEALYSDVDEYQKIYDSLPISDDTFNLKRENLNLFDKLGSGCFGSVMKGVYVRRGKNIQVAVKTIKEGSSVDESAMMKEAKLMSKLQHRHIVRMIGLCKAETLMLVLELAALGPLHKYLKNHLSMTVSQITELVFQVARGMEYLESVNFIHRDLAARNVLLVNEEFAKISDFGMSKALEADSNYYKEAQPGKWPVKWYAPECFYYYKFDTKSDVWSFGVTCWEAFSYGAKPYRGMNGQGILAYIEAGNRLDQPEHCPGGMYELMHQCWQKDKTIRPAFSEIVEIIRKFKS